MQSLSSNAAEHGCLVESNDFVLRKILSRLPAKSLMRFKSVSKRWISIIKQDKYFIDMQETRRCKDITSFLVYPTWPSPVNTEPRCPLPGSVNIRSIPFSQEDLRFGDHTEGSLIDSSTSVADVVPLCHNVNLNVEFNMLEPVYGLACFINYNDGPEAGILIYNPCTGEKTPWITTSTSEVFVSDFGQEHGADSGGERWILCHNHMFGFGFDPTTKQHKVLCVYEITGHADAAWPGSSNPPRHNKVICGVLTVGDNRWRKIDDHLIPPGIELDRKCVYANGSICWINYLGYPRPCEIIMFDVGSETFRAITVPECIPMEVWSWFNRTSVELVNVLVEVEGHLAILVQEGSVWLNMWIYNDDNGGNAGGNWVKETIQLPCQWSDLLDLDFKDIPGTDLVVIKFRQKHGEFLRYYNKKEKKYYQNRFESEELTHPCVDRYQITPFFETLLPVRALKIAR